MSWMTDGGKADKRRSVLLWMIAILVMAVILTVFWWKSIPSQESAPDFVMMGDSIYTKGRGWDTVADKLTAKLQVNILNAALGGTSMSRVDREKWMDHAMDSMSMISLSKAILTKDFSVQRQANIKEPATDYFQDTIKELEKVDFKKVRILFLGYGMNDYQSGVPLENAGNSGDAGMEYSFSGALRRVLSGLKREYPSLRIILISPTYSWYLSNGKSCEEQDWGGGVLEQYVQCEQGIAREYGVEFLDLYHGLYEHENFEDWERYTVDGVHPNETGRALLADAIEDYLEEHP